MPRRPAITLAALVGLALFPCVHAVAATLTLDVTNNGLPLEDPTHCKFYVYEPEKRDDYVAWGHAAKPARFPEGQYDIVIRYLNGEIREERVQESVELAGEVRQEVAFQIPVARLTLDITAGSQPIPAHAGRFSLFAAGRRGKPLGSKRPGETVTVRPGTYDVEVTYRDVAGLQSTWLNGLTVDGSRHETVQIGAAPANLQLTLTLNGKDLDADQARWRVYKSGVRQNYQAEAGSGKTLSVAAGTYDIALLYDQGGARIERWLDSVELTGTSERRVEVAAEDAALKVNVHAGGSFQSQAWFAVYAEGDRRKVLSSGRSGSEIQLEPGTYDIGCFARRDGLRPEKWLEARRVAGRVELDVDLDFEPASLRVLPGAAGSGRAGQANVLVLLDSSIEMRSKLGSRTRMEVALESVGDFVDRLPRSDVNAGLRVYGIAPRSQHDCFDSALLAPLQPAGDRSLASTLRFLRPAGYSPIAYSLEQARQDLPAGGRNTVLLLAGSADSCHGAPCAAAAELRRSGVAERIYVVGLDLDGDQQRQLDCVGEYYSVKSRRELNATLEDIARSISLSREGTVSVFRSGWSGWIASGSVGEQIEIASGVYDILVRSGDETYTWENVAINGDVERLVGP